MLVTGEPGVGKTELLDAASEAASANETRIILRPSFRAVELGHLTERHAASA